MQEVFRECFQDFNICVGRDAEGQGDGGQRHLGVKLTEHL